MQIYLKLPLPVSVNKAYATNFKTKRRFKSQEYTNWEESAKIEMRKFPKYIINEDNWLKVEYRFFMPIYLKKPRKNGTDKKVVDVFNMEKALSDFLSTQIEGFEDHKIKEGKVSKTHCEDEPFVEVFISEI